MLFECNFIKGGDNFVCNNVIRTINSLFLCQTLLRPAAMLIVPLSTLPSPVHHYPGHSLCWIHSYTIANLNMDKCVCVCVFELCLGVDEGLNIPIWKKCFFLNITCSPFLYYFLWNVHRMYVGTFFSPCLLASF